MRLVFLPFALLPLLAALAQRPATVASKDGLSVFVHAEPLDPYVILGPVMRARFSLFPWPDQSLEAMERNVRRRYPGADGLLVRDGRFRHALAVRFER